LSVAVVELKPLELTVIIWRTLDGAPMTAGSTVREADEA
jgi:hypothetical protein